MPAVAFVYVLLMPFMSALAPAEWTPLPLLLLIVVTPLLIIRSSQADLAFVARHDWPFALMFCCGLAGIFFSTLPMGIKNLNYSLAVLVCYFFFFFMARRLLCERSVRWELVGSCCQWSLGVLSAGVITEFYLASFHGIFFADVIHFAHKDLTIANLVTAEFKRPRAFAAEPGFTALAYECLWPLTLLARRQRWWQHAAFAVAFLMLASAAAVACLGLALSIVWAAGSRDWRSAAKFLLMVLAALVPLLATEVGQEAAWVVFGRKVDVSAAAEFYGAEDARTLFDRLNSYDISSTLLLDHPLGIGWGSLGQAFADQVNLPGIGQLNGSGLLSLYLDIIVASGIAGLFFWLLFIGLRLRVLLVSRDPRARLVAVALLSVGLHHMFITEIQIPFLWFALALADKLSIHIRHQATRRRLTDSKAPPPPASAVPTTRPNVGLG